MNRLRRTFQKYTLKSLVSLVYCSQQLTTTHLTRQTLHRTLHQISLLQTQKSSNAQRYIHITPSQSSSMLSKSSHHRETKAPTRGRHIPLFFMKHSHPNSIHKSLHVITPSNSVTVLYPTWPDLCSAMKGMGLVPTNQQQEQAAHTFRELREELAHRVPLLSP